MTTIEKITLNIGSTQVNAFCFIPDEEKCKQDNFAIFTHGFTSHKASILNWATRLSDEGVPTLVFDQPGHFLGSFNEVESFEIFKEVAPELFLKAYEYLKTKFPSGGSKLVIGGHSLGALTSLMALERQYFNLETLLCICVGFGLPPEGITHIFNTPFYKSTLNLRGQLVSKNLDPADVFPWIKEQKEALTISNQRIHFIAGVDDVVVGKDGPERLAKDLTDLGNEVSLDRPNKLAHHLPEMAAAHIKKFLKDQSFL